MFNDAGICKYINQSPPDIVEMEGLLQGVGREWAEEKIGLSKSNRQGIFFLCFTSSYVLRLWGGGDFIF